MLLRVPSLPTPRLRVSSFALLVYFLLTLVRSSLLLSFPTFSWIAPPVLTVLLLLPSFLRLQSIAYSDAYLQVSAILS